jgi:tagaturonate reductase
MRLTKHSLESISRQNGLSIPGKEIFSLPEKVLQFGTGVLLRGLPDYFIDKANKQGIFNGRIVVVKSTATAGADAFDEQDGLYTLCVRGVEQGKQIEEDIINASISRVVSAKTDWDKILLCAENPEIQIIISNTTEIGIILVNESIHAAPPESFPAKLLAVLYRRFKALNGDKDKGLVIIPTELITDNGKKLKGIVQELAVFNKLEDSFIEWLNSANHFCNSLVDRIVPGKLPADQQTEVERSVGYEDKLMIMSEVYRLWAIETDNEKVKALLSFSQADSGVVLTKDITKYKELKLRLLNGSHTFTCALAILKGFNTVKEAMKDNGFSSFIRDLMMQEIVPAITGDIIPVDDAIKFAENVLDRYSNPFLEHQWMSISVQYTSKMRMRNVPLLKWHFEKTGKLPQKMAIGFAAYLLFMHSEVSADGSFAGEINGKKYILNDQYAATLSSAWKNDDDEAVVDTVLRGVNLWETDLTAIPGLSALIKDSLLTVKNKYFSKLA